MLPRAASRWAPTLEWLEAEDYLLLGAILLLPWAFGGVEIWAYRGAALLLAAAAAVALGKEGWAGLGLGRGTRWLLPAFLLGLWALLQIVPLPPVAVRLLSPNADAIYRDTFPGYPGPAPQNVVQAIEDKALAEVPEASGLPGPSRTEGLFGTVPPGRWSGWRPLSLLPVAGVERVFWYGALLLAFLLVRRRTEEPELAHLYRDALFGLFVALAVFGLIYAATANGKLYWVRAVREQAHPFGPYVSPTNFAAVMELGVPWLLGYALVVTRRMGGGLHALARTPIFAVGAALCLVAGLATASKVAALLLVVSVGVLLLVAARSARARLATLAATVVVGAGAALLLVQTRLGERVRLFVQSTEADVEGIDRWVALKASLPIFQDFPLTGSGFGSFREVFGRYLPRGEYLIWEQLHNDYAEVLVEGGLIAAVLLVWLTVAFWIRLLRRRNRGAERGPDLERWGLLLGLAALSLHAAVDFNHQIPANALLFVTVGAFALTHAVRPPEEPDGAGRDGATRGAAP